MGVKKLKAKVELNYRHGYAWKHCGECDHFVANAYRSESGGKVAREEHRCRVIGVEPGRMWRINRMNICDRFDNTKGLARLKGQITNEVA